MNYSDLYLELQAARKPVLLIGGGCKPYKEQFRQLTEVLRIPAYATWNALDVVTSDLPVYAGVVGTYGGPGRNFGVAASDLLIAVGTRLSGRVTGGRPNQFAPNAKKVWVDIDPGLKYHDCGIEPALVDAGEFMAELARRLGGEKLEKPEWLARCREWMVKYDPVRPEMLEGSFHHYGFMRKLSEAIPANAIIVYDTGGSAIMMGHCFKSKWGQTIFSSNGNSPMGFAFCGALGAWFADSRDTGSKPVGDVQLSWSIKRPIICIIGDGGFNMNIQELQTMVNYGCNVKTFILNNHVYGNTKLWQKSNNKAFVACGPDGYKPPDFLAIADAYNVESFSIDSWTDFDFVVDMALKGKHVAGKTTIQAMGGPVIVDVVHHDFYDYYPRISRFDQDLHDQEPHLPREEIEANFH